MVVPAGRGRVGLLGFVVAAAAVPVRAEVPVDTLLDVIQPFPTFSEAVLWALLELEL